MLCEYVPGGHSEQAGAPSAGLKRPGAHGVHSTEPGTPANHPFGQL